MACEVVPHVVARDTDLRKKRLPTLPDQALSSTQSAASQHSSGFLRLVHPGPQAAGSAEPCAKRSTWEGERVGQLRALSSLDSQ